jgi:hypothetical protein
MIERPNGCASRLRQELIARNHAHARRMGIAYVASYGELPVVVYQPSVCGQYHGNFLAPSYQAILKNPRWRRRLEKVHAQARRCLPVSERRWCELDSSLSSDALLMNIFCYPRVTRRKELLSFLGIEPGICPEFGFRPRIPVITGAVERTEIDMKLGTNIFEAKLTETDFQMQRADLVERYRDLREVFDCRQLPRAGKKYSSYQLIRNILAAYHLHLEFCALIDGRRPDLLEYLYTTVSAIRWAELRARCRVLTWQELARCLPAPLRQFLASKYGIVPG